ncbi:unnamed protein product, partial [Brassica oleracea]
GGGGATVTALTPRAVKKILPTSIDYDGLTKWKSLMETVLIIL